MRASRVPWVVGGLAVSLGLCWSVWRWSGLSPSALAHFPVPVFTEARAAPLEPVPAAEARLDAAAAEAPVVANVGGRVSALLMAGDDLWIGTFDRGLYRVTLMEEEGLRGDGEPGEALRGGSEADARGLEGALLEGPFDSLRGPEGFVNALLLDGLDLLVATARGVVRLDVETGVRRNKMLDRRPVLALARGAAGRVYAAASDGIHVLERGASHPLAVPGLPRGPVTALAASGDVLHAGTSRGVYSVEIDPLSGAAVHVQHHPLVVGSSPAGSAVVTALAVDPDTGAVWAGTDDAGLVRVGSPGEAFLLAPRAASLVNPGAALALGGGAVLFGTQGGGAVVAFPGAPPFRLTGGDLDETTALTARAAELDTSGRPRFYAGTAAGTVRALPL